MIKYDIVRIIRSVVINQGVATDFSDVDWNSLWYDALKNHLEGIVYLAAKEHCELVPKVLFQQMQREYYKMTSRDVLQINLLERIEAKMKEAGIPYALQKGSILRYDYPDSIMRFMSDLDIYIDPHDRDRIKTAMEQIDGVFRGKESGDDQFLFYNKFGVEFHGRLLYRKNNKGIIENYPALEYINSDKNRLTEEGYALNLIGHAVGDLAKGGPGVRYILDLWIYRNRHIPQPDWDRVFSVLEQDGILIASKNLLDLSEYLFGQQKETELIKEMAEYVLQGGLHGDPHRSSISEIAITGGKSKALFHQLFRSRVEFENRYPWLKKYPFLIPVAWVMRLTSSIKRHGRVIRSWNKRVNKASNQEIERQRVILRRFGL